jgi:hypothetical protein
MTVKLSLQPATLTVEPGGQAACIVTVRNTSTIVEQFTITVLGEPSAWAQVDPPAISLLPEGERTVTVVFRPPRAPVPRAANLPFAVKAIPTKQAEDTAVEEGDITVNPFIEVMPALKPRASRGATVGHHVLRLTNRGNTPVDAALTASDPDELLKLRVRPTQLRMLPGATSAARVDVRPRKIRFFGQPQPLPFQVQVQPTGAPMATVDASLMQRPILPNWLPKLAAGLAVLAIGTTLYARKISNIKSIAIAASATTVAPINVKPGATTTPAGGTTTTTGGRGTTGAGGAGAGGAGAGGAGGAGVLGAAGAGTAADAPEPGVKAQDLSCDPYDPTRIQVTAAPAPSSGATTTATTAVTVIYTVGTNNPKVTFQFANPVDAGVANSILSQYKQVCYVGSGAPLAAQAMVLEPFQQKLPVFPNISGAKEKCDNYNNAPATLLAKPPDATHTIAWIADLTTSPVTPLDVQDVETNVQIARQVALAHTQRCWVGGGTKWTSLDHPPGSVLEYWR